MHKASIRSQYLTLFILGLSHPLASAELTMAQTSQMKAGQQQLSVVGSAAYRERIALPPDAELVVELREHALGLGSIVAELRTSTNGGQVPLPFKLEVDWQKIVPGTEYAVRAAVQIDGAVRWLSETTTISPEEVGKVELGLLQIHRHKPIDFAVTYKCGFSTVRLDVQEDKAILKVNDETFKLEKVAAASGMKYQAGNDASTYLWSKGDNTVVSVRATSLPECVRQDDEADIPSGRSTLPGAEWVVQDVGGKGIIDRSRATLQFTADGQLSGRASCNRYIASYATNGDRIHVAPQAAMTLMACPEALMNQERRFMDLLKTTKRWLIDNTGALRLEKMGGKAILARRE